MSSHYRHPFAVGSLCALPSLNRGTNSETRSDHQGPTSFRQRTLPATTVSATVKGFSQTADELACMLPLAVACVTFFYVLNGSHAVICVGHVWCSCLLPLVVWFVWPSTSHLMQVEPMHAVRVVKLLLDDLYDPYDDNFPDFSDNFGSLSSFFVMLSQFVRYLPTTF